MIKIVINGTDVGVKDLETLTFKSDFENRITEAEFNFDKITIPDPYKNVIDNFIQERGPFVGIPASIQFGEINIDAYADLSKDFEIKDREYTVKLKKRKGYDNFFEFAAGATFTYLALKGVNFPEKKIPYVIIRDNQAEMALTLFVLIVITLQAIAEQIRRLADQNADTTEAIGIDVVGDATQEIANIIRIGANIIYLAALVGYLVTLVVQLVELIFPRIREFNACSIYDLIKKSCEFKGYQFQSSLLENMQEVVIIPATLTEVHDDIFSVLENRRMFEYNRKFPSSLDTVSTVDDLIKSVETLFNAETKVSNGIVKIETASYWEKQASLNFEETFNIQGEIQTKSRLNTNEAYIRHYLHYQTDFTDLHTVNEFANTVTEYAVGNLYPLEEDLNLFAGLYDASFPFARAVVKGSFSFVESLALDVISKIDSFTKKNTSVIISNRIGLMQISQQFFATTKIHAVNNIGYIFPQKYKNLNPDELWTKYHRREVIDQNGWEIIEDMPMIMDEEKFLSLFDNNYCIIKGTSCKVLSVIWNPYYSSGMITFKRRNDYALGKITLQKIS